MSDRFEIMSAKGKPLTVWLNPCMADLELMPELVRFTADYDNRNIYLWDFRLGYHSDVSVALKLYDTFNSGDFLKGHARRSEEGLYEMIGSDFLESFTRKVTAADRALLIKLLKKDWTWISGFINAIEWLELFRLRFQYNLTT